MTPAKPHAQYTVTGSVDAQNSFGAQIRTDYVCTIEVHGKSGSTVDVVIG